MSKFIVLVVAFAAVDCQLNQLNPNSTIVLDKEGAANATKIVMEFVSGMGRALQQLLTSGSNPKPQMIAYGLNSTDKQENYRIEGEKLREEIVKRVNSLQTVIGTAIQVARDRRDVISKRILEQANNRLQSAKERADKVLREPNTSEIAVRSLRTINSGVNHLSTFVNSLLGRVNISIKVDVKEKPENEVLKKQ